MENTTLFDNSGLEDATMFENITKQVEPGGGYSEEALAIIGIILALINIVTFVGNVIVIIAVYITPALQSLTGFFIVSLAVSDILVGALVMPFAIYREVRNGYWPFGNAICDLSKSLDIMFSTASIYNLLCVAIDRYFAICRPFFYHERFNKKVVISMIACCWILPIFPSFVSVFAKWPDIGVEEMIQEMTNNGTLPVCPFKVSPAYTIATSLLLFYIPAGMMIVVYSIIFYIARSQSRKIQALEIADDRDKRSEARNMKRERKAARTLLIIMGAFLLCWLPLYLFNIIDVSIGYKIPGVPWGIVSWLGWMNSMFNPWIYYACNSNFKAAYVRIFSLGKRRMDVEDSLASASDH
ncbi:unnamed protein product [Owenia fusiformis]|uniref:Uncharacterized protein n=1 Tax=Owenia fusiformis TaxID=6347 RepID=A0A8J1XXV3_OWEFU|nr:unnamed protein product [Owenia fusiformis]